MKKLILIGLIIMISLLIVGCYKDYEDRLMEEGAKAYEEYINKNEEIQTHCRSLIPDRIILIRNDTGVITGENYYYPDDIEYYWTDGMIMREELTGEAPIFVRGKDKGENVNYLYSELPLDYKKTEISDEGIVGDAIEYEIQLVLDIRDKTE